MQSTATNNTPAVKTTPTFTENLENAMAKGNASYRVGLMNYLVAYQKNVVDVYTDATRKYNQFLRDMSDLDVLITSSVKAVGDKGEKVEIDYDAIGGKLKEIWDKYYTPVGAPPNPNSTLFISTATGEDGRQQALAWAKEFGLSEGQVREIPSTDGSPSTYVVNMNLNPLGKYDEIFYGTGKKEMFFTEWDTLQKAQGGQFDNIKNDIQLITSDLGRRLQQFNNICTNQASTNESNVNAYKAYIW
jgi:hypothetical protein